MSNQEFDVDLLINDILEEIENNEEEEDKLKEEDNKSKEENNQQEQNPENNFPSQRVQVDQNEIDKTTNKMIAMKAQELIENVQPQEETSFDLENLDIEWKFSVPSS